MQTGYFSAAWNDLRNSPGWFGKVVVLSLVGLIPIFGWIVIYGYLFGWARDIAWNIHAPLPARVFGNEDGKLYGRGFFVLVISFVCMLIPWLLDVTWSVLTGFGAGWSGGWQGGMLAFLGLSSLMFSVLMVVASLFATLFFWVGSMRMGIYGRLAPGLQFGKIWLMMRHDFAGLARILGMALLLGVGSGLVIFAVIILFVFIGTMVGVAASAPLAFMNDPGVLFSVIPGIVGLVIILALVCSVVCMMLSVGTLALVVRALGYWTRQFDVSAWRGQDDPLPFEVVAASDVPGAWR